GAATSRGKVSVGADGVGTVRGNGVRIRGGLGALLTIAEERDDSNTVKWWKSFKIDGKRYRPDTWYRLDEGGKVVRCDDENAE
ncbi:MAG: hypothetical protein IJU66_00070, partial [Oscillospiraceae bacterium]|nr:hypothetical protein [Oscillospiraceae bacterium]